jgi:hypothetical protein
MSILGRIIMEVYLFLDKIKVFRIHLFSSFYGMREIWYFLLSTAKNHIQPRAVIIQSNRISYDSIYIYKDLMYIPYLLQGLLI